MQDASPPGPTAGHHWPTTTHEAADSSRFYFENRRTKGSRQCPMQCCQSHGFQQDLTRSLASDVPSLENGNQVRHVDQERTDRFSLGLKETRSHYKQDPQTREKNSNKSQSQHVGSWNQKLSTRNPAYWSQVFSGTHFSFLCSWSGSFTQLRVGR